VDVGLRICGLFALRGKSEGKVSTLRDTAIRTVATVFGCLVVASPSWAATATAIVNVTASVTQKCKITTADVVLGKYDPVVRL
jgi:hypothetical protein